MNGVVARVPVTESSQVSEARWVALGCATDIGFGETECGKVAIVATELATNLVKHGEHGELLVRSLKQEGVPGIEILALDKGPGISNITESMRDGYSTSGSPGTGLGAISRMSTSLDIYSEQGKGAAFLARIIRKSCPASRAAVEVGGLSVAVKGEQLCGDCWSYRSGSNGAVLLAVDGLGHGLQAEEAASGAVESFDRKPDASPAELLKLIHLNIRSTRGAAACVASIDTQRGMVRYAGVGNLSGVVLSPGAARHMVSMTGTLGYEIRLLREFEYPWSPESVLVLHSDGVSARWDLKDYPGLDRKPAALIAGVLYRDYRRERDDATVVVVKNEADAG